MRRRRFVLPSPQSAALAAARRTRRCRPRRRPTADHPGADRSRQEGRQGHLLHGDGPLRRRADGQGLRGEVSRHQGRGRAHRRRAAVQPHRPGESAATSAASTSPTAPMPRTSSSWKREGWLAPFVTAGHGARTCRPTSAIPTAPSSTSARTCQRHRLQHQPGEAEDAPKSFADLLDPKWVGQDGEGASRLLRHDHDGDPAARAGAGLGVLREARQAEGAAGPVGDRAAEEASRPASAPSPSTAATISSGWPRSAARRSRSCMRSRARR